MNCQDLNRLLAESNNPLPPSAIEHLNACPGCRNLFQTLGQPLVLPDPVRLEHIYGNISSSLQPVRPLPSDSKLTLLLLTAFIVFSILAALAIGVKGYFVMSLTQRLVYYGAILVLATLLSNAVVKQLIPGSATGLRPAFLISAGLVCLALLAVVLFQAFGLNHFVKLGIPCLSLGSLGALAGAFLGSFLVRWGLATAPRRTGVLTGFFAGLAGFAVLALHCPYLNAPHILVWHLAPVVLATCCGALVGALLEPQPQQAAP